jgi:hypothetical protein
VIIRTLAYSLAALIALCGVAWGQVCAHEDQAEGELMRAGYRVLVEGVDDHGVRFRLYSKHNGEWVLVYQPQFGIWCVGKAGPSLQLTERCA